MHKIYCYCRVATEENRNLEEQKEVVTNYCKKSSLKIDKFFCESGSGMKLNQELCNMVNYLNIGDIVIVKDRARLSRSNVLFQTIKDAIYEQGARLVVVDEATTLESDFEDIITQIQCLLKTKQ